MNANELADALDWVCENHLIGIGNADFKATATMLRQQQSEIEGLKLHIQGLQASITLGEKYMARKDPVETLENIGAILRKVQEK